MVAAQYLMLAVVTRAAGHGIIIVHHPLARGGRDEAGRAQGAAVGLRAGRFGQLRAWITDIVASERAPLTLFFESFAFKLGVPLDADFVFDVRALPNPYYDLALRPLDGRDAPVIAFLDAQPSALELLADIRAFIEKWLPSFKSDNRSYLTVALGCTGGQHRSVYMAERLAQYFGPNERVVLRHRERS